MKLSPPYIFMLAWIFMGLTLSSCQEDLVEPEDFTRILDSYNGATNYDPIDIAATNTGLLVLAGSNSTTSDFLQTTLIYLDENGDFLQLNTLDLVAPVGKMVQINEVVYFFAMNPSSLQVSLVQVADTTGITEVPLAGGLSYPLGMAATSSETLLLLSYDTQNQSHILSEIDLTGTILQSQAYSTGPGSDYENAILSSLIDPNMARIPFFCGEWAPGQYYYNGIYNYSLSTVFSNFSAEPTGIIQGQNLNGGISALLPLSGSDFMLAGFQFSQQFYSASETLPTSGLASSINYFNNPISELADRAPVRLMAYELDNVEYAILGSATLSQQIVLYFFERSTGRLAGIYKFGHINPYEFRNITQDADGNLILLSRTYVGGRFSRIGVHQLSLSQIRSVINP